MEHIDNNEMQSLNNNEEAKYSPKIDPQLLIDTQRPESTEIRIDPGGYTGTNFHKSNDSAFFLPEIKIKEGMYDNPPHINNIQRTPMDRQGHTAALPDPAWSNHYQNRINNGKNK